MTDRTLRISAKLAEEIQQWASDELGMWPRDTAYAADLESLLAQLTAAQPSRVDVSGAVSCCHQHAVALADKSRQPAPDAVAETDAWRDVLAERQRQISAEGWTPDHDDCHDRSELAQAAACYALSGTPADKAVFIHGRWKDPRDLFWPWSWDRSWWKPTDRRRDLVKAGALILAEIERLDRIAKGSRT